MGSWPNVRLHLWCPGLSRCFLFLSHCLTFDSKVFSLLIMLMLVDVCAVKHTATGTGINTTLAIAGMACAKSLPSPP